MCYQAFCFHRQGFEDVLWWRDKQVHTIPCAAGDDSATMTSCTLDVTKYIADMALLHQKIKFLQDNPVDEITFLSLASFMDGDKLYLVKNLARLFYKTNYAGNNSVFLNYPALYHLAIYGALK